jgi:hypothetical protein
MAKKYLYQLAVRYSKLLQNITTFPFQGAPKCTQIRILSMKYYHLATLESLITEF